MFGWQPDGSAKASGLELVRFAFPRRVYTQSHVDHVCEVLLSLNSVAPKIRGVTIVDQPPALRHFTAKRAPAAGRMIEA